MSESRKKPGVAFWATVVLLVALVAYPLGFGPACWWFSPRSIDAFALPHRPGALKVYWPIGWLAKHGPKPVTDTIRWYALLGTDFVWVQASPSGDWTFILK